MFSRDIEIDQWHKIKVNSERKHYFKFSSEDNRTKSMMMMPS